MSGPEPIVQPDPVAAVKRTIPIKEPPPFKWKLMGYVDGLTVTLLKAIEREDAEAQQKRLAEEGYYRGLEIYPIDGKVPADPEAARHAKERKVREKTAAEEKAKKEAAMAKKAGPKRPPPSRGVMIRTTVAAKPAKPAKLAKPAKSAKIAPAKKPAKKK